MFELQVGDRLISFVADPDNLVDSGLLVRLEDSVRLMSLDPKGLIALKSLPAELQQIVVAESIRGPMSFSNFGSAATLTINSSYWLNSVEPDFLEASFIGITAHEILHGSINIDKATSSFIKGLFEINPELNDVISPFDLQLRGVVEHIFVNSGQHVIMESMVPGQGTIGYKLYNALEELKSKVPSLTNLDLVGVEGLMSALAGEALPGLTTAKCFLAGTQITMADGHRKPIETIELDDWVLSVDERTGQIVPGKVVQTFQNQVRIVLDFHGTGVTPGHVYYCAGGKFAGEFTPLIDILRDDGVVRHEDGSHVRASTGCIVGSGDDREFWAFLPKVGEQGAIHVAAKCRLRLGTRWMLSDGSHFSMREYMDSLGCILLEDGSVYFEETGLTTIFLWTLSDRLPRPEDFVMARSGTTLDDIYRADEWESVRPQMPVPQGGSRPTEAVVGIKRNNPMMFRAGQPTESNSSGRGGSNRGAGQMAGRDKRRSVLH